MQKRNRLYLLITVLSALYSPAGIGCGSPFDPEEGLIGLSGRIYFNSTRTGDSEIYVMNPDGTGITNLTRSPGTGDTLCTISPDGTRIAFMRGEMWDWDKQEIWIMDADGSNQVQLTNNNKADGHPDFSPDGTQIVFSSWRDDDNEEIYIMNADGSNQRRITNHPAPDNDPDWSPDGRFIAFKSTRAYWTGEEDDFLDLAYEIFITDTGRSPSHHSQVQKRGSSLEVVSVAFKYFVTRRDVNTICVPICWITANCLRKKDLEGM